MSLRGGLQADVAISWYNLSYCTAFWGIVPEDCHVALLLAMTVVVDTWSHILIELRETIIYFSK